MSNSNLAVIDMTDLSVTPVFKILEIENIPQSEREGHLVLQTKEMVEVRIAGDKNYSPAFPAQSAWRREGNRTITYAERWPEQYRAFKEGDPQEAMGTPLEMLRPLGVSPELISLCRALKIYSIEALDRLEERGVKALGMNANTLKAAAAKFLADRQGGVAMADELAKVKAELAALKAGAVPADETPPEMIDAMVADADATFADMSDEDIKEEIAKLAGSKPRGNPSRAALETALKELLEAA